MKPPYRTLVLIATAATAAAAVFASLWLTSEATKEPAVGEPSPFLPSPPAPPRETFLFGHIGSLTRAEDDSSCASTLPTSSAERRRIARRSTMA